MAYAEDEGVNPAVFAKKLHCMLALVLADCLCNGFADSLWSEKYMMLNVVLCVLPVIIHLLEVLLFFMLLWHTFLLRYGLLLEVWDEFSGLLLFSAIRFAILLAARLPRLLAVVDDWTIAEYWDEPLHHAMFFVHNIVSVIYSAWLLRRSYALAKVRFYKPQVFQRHQKPGSHLRRLGA
eukprot:TRINITY_DN41482_c0_g1_i1.p1 TRINITY_DN41482_c0_g1~~TRINITY_DN41482_c0_g1_i1.p1  ORF type:complete len:179 (-),score=47.85 TRINITY_DN41482_c0_g1_i1:201-737(-)